MLSGFTISLHFMFCYSIFHIHKFVIYFSVSLRYGSKIPKLLEWLYHISTNVSKILHRSCLSTNRLARIWHEPYNFTFFFIKTKILLLEEFGDKHCDTRILYITLDILGTAKHNTYTRWRRQYINKDTLLPILFIKKSNLQLSTDF